MRLYVQRIRLARVAIVLALGAVVAGTSEARAEEPAPETETAQEPKDVTGANFAVQVKAVEERLSRIRAELSAIDVAGEVNDSLDAIEAEEAALAGRLGAIEARRMMSSELNTLRTQLDLLDVRIVGQISRLSLYANELETLSTQNEEDIGVWKRALRSVSSAAIPQPLRDRAGSILRGLREGQKELDKKLGEVLELQSRVLDVRDDVRLAEERVRAERRVQADSLFQRQKPPIWKPDDYPAGDVRGGYDIRFSWPDIEDYVRTEREPLVIQALLILLLGWLFVRARKVVTARIDGRQPGGGMPWEDQAAEALRHPWAAALLLGLASVRLFHPDRAVDIIVLTWIVLPPLWFVVFKEFVPRFRPALIALGLLGTLQVVVTLVSGHPGVERALLLIESLLAVGAAAWMVRFLRHVELPKRSRQGLWFSATNLWTRLVLAIAVVGVGATVLGYTYFAAEAAMLTILGTIAATACMAIARIIEALLSTWVYAGELDGLRMVRANRDVTAKTLSRIVRILAVALFAWTLTDMTSVWRRMGRTIGDALSADLGVGLAETGVTFGDFFAFFVVLWISWLVSRLVSFVLQEELLPRLHMQDGVPFALTTFTRYAIIVIGFVAALSVLSVSFDRLTIVLSALGVGIGFGLQGIVNNVVSGFVLLTERPVRLRDKVEIDGVLGHVSNIGIRASTIRTFDGAEVIVPNGDLISGRVVNWTLSARRQRVTIPVGVAYGTDPNKVLGILRRLAAENEKVFKTPAPLALFRGFGESSLDFELRIFMDPSDVLEVPSAVTVAINDALTEAGVEIPFPQRDLHIRDRPETQRPDVTDADPDDSE